MKRICIACLAVFAAVTGFAAGLEFTIANDHTNLIYRVGEEAAFTVTVTRDGKPVAGGFVDAKLDNYGPNVQLSNRVDLAKGNPFTVKGRLAEPGFLRLTLKANDTAKVWGVGYEPERIEKGSPLPADFDAFWSDARAKLAREVPLDAKVISRIEWGQTTFAGGIS